MTGYCLRKLNCLFISQGLDWDQKDQISVLTFFVHCLACESVQGPQKVKVVSSNNVVTAKDIIIATGSVPFVPKGIEVDGTSYTSSFIFSIHDIIILC